MTDDRSNDENAPKRVAIPPLPKIDLPPLASDEEVARLHEIAARGQRAEDAARALIAADSASEGREGREGRA